MPVPCLWSGGRRGKAGPDGLSALWGMGRVGFGRCAAQAPDTPSVRSARPPARREHRLSFEHGADPHTMPR
ncbi:hypothetical protein OK074_6229 [Actinobacteria bacterium OK074]|nr:hypothetical protein OK074_6229 [Actinobacteria bacterium OK074]